MTQLFTMKNHKTITYRGENVPRAAELLAWFNVDGKLNSDVNKTVFLDHVNHAAFFSSQNPETWIADIFENVGGKTFMKYPSPTKGAIRKNIGTHKITEMDLTFILNVRPNAYATLVTTQGAGEKAHGGFTIWIDPSNHLTVATIFDNGAGGLEYWQQAVGTALVVGNEYRVNVKISESTKKITVSVNDTIREFTYNSAFLVPTKPRELIIGSEQSDGNNFPRADFKLHEVKVYKGV